MEGKVISMRASFGCHNSIHLLDFALTQFCTVFTMLVQSSMFTMCSYGLCTLSVVPIYYILCVITR